MSQNAKQFNITQYEDPAVISAAASQGNTVRAYSYTLYDKIGRIIEVGELLTDQAVVTYKNESQVQYAAHTAFVATGAYKHQTSKTVYDRNATPPQNFNPTYLRNRVAYTTYQQEQNSPVQETHYSYDVHGNVNSLLQMIRHDGNILAKTVDYEYDLISGKVNKVYYQKAKADQLIHKYTYDGDNRITKVETSTDDVLYTKEATYQYYAHGPLARTQLGELNVETQNYAYTVQGWIKQMQAEAFGYALGYNNTDYSSIGTTNILATPIATGKSLYNGNIASMTSKTPVIANTNWQQQYSYDQLNRITSSATPGSPATNAYKTTYSYDANGNILNLARYNGENTKFDELSYNYQTKAKGYLQNTNKLRWVDDAVGTTATTADIEDQSLDNYSYDAIGNLVKDNQEEIAKIEWTVSGKVRRVTRSTSSNKPDLEFEYDASGQRIVKKVIKKNGEVTSTYYLRDASGNVMAVYNYNANSDNDPALTEQYLYGSSRIGVYTPAANVLSKTRVFGSKSYELSDHLGNVRATLSDYRRAASAATVNSATDYYPFGMVARSYASAEQYRYGFNGVEKESDWNDSYSFEYRMYDPRLARFLTVDPIARSFSWQSPYVFAANSPIKLIDYLGLGPGVPAPGELSSERKVYKGGNARTAGTLVSNRKEVDKIYTKPSATTGMINILAPNGKYFQVPAAGMTYTYSDGSVHDDQQKLPGVWSVSYGGKNFMWDNIKKAYVPNNSNKGGGDNRYIFGATGTTYAGRSNPKNLYTEDDDYSQPIQNMADEAGFIHDQAYDDLKIGGISGVLSAQSTPANKQLIANAQKVVDMYNSKQIDPYTGMPVSKRTLENAEKIILFFNEVETGKVNQANKRKIFGDAWRQITSDDFLEGNNWGMN